MNTYIYSTDAYIFKFTDDLSVYRPISFSYHSFPLRAL